MKTITLPVKLIVLFALLLVAGFTRGSDDPIDKLVSALQKWADNNPQEKIYLHTDKPYYLIGDTIWLKAYVTIGSRHQLSALSGAVYVDLITEGDSIAQTIKLPVTTGMAAGNFILYDSLLREGNYRIRAYTQWMRNAGPDYFYDRTFTVGNSVANSVFAKIDYIYTKDGDKTKIRALLKYTDHKGKPYAGKKVTYQLKESYKIITTGGGTTNAIGEISINLPNSKPGVISSQYLVTKLNVEGRRMLPKTFPIKTASQQTDVQFFPESGSLVNGVKSRVAFKATGTNGLGVAITGTVTDNDNKQIAQITAKHLGMGFFYLTPEAGKTYSAKITYPDGSVNTMPLPGAVNDGYVLSAYNQKDSVLVRISSGPGIVKTGNKNLSLIGQAGGEVYFSVSVPEGKSVTSLYFPVADIPAGILQFTLFSADGKPLNERIVFISNKNSINLNVSAPKRIYNRREKIALAINANDKAGKPIAGNFSVSVVSEAAIPSDEVRENSIFAQLLLSADIKGYIEKPNYYFYNENDETRANLDILMLTQGYRRFAWKNILAGPQQAPAYKAEPLINEVSGRLSTLTGNKPIPGGKVTLINNKLKLVLDTVTDAQGNFKFGNLIITDGIKFTVQGRSATNSDKVLLTVNQPSIPDVSPNNNTGDVNADIPQLIKAAVDNSIKQDMELQKQGKLSRVQQLNQVDIRKTKPTFGAGNIKESEADEVFRPDSRMPCATLMECLTEMYKSRIQFHMTLSGECGNIWVPYFGKGRYVVIIDSVLIAPCEYQSIFLDDMLNISKVYTSHESPGITGKLLGNYLFMLINGANPQPPPVIAIYTKHGNWRNSYNPSVVYYEPKGYSYAKQFYTPKYDNPIIDTGTDLRSTVYWNPSILTGAKGQAQINYFNSDQVGTYRVTIEGIDAEGRLGRQVYRYGVE
jgi:hypothetical protein